MWNKRILIGIIAIFLFSIVSTKDVSAVTITDHTFQFVLDNTVINYYPHNLSLSNDSNLILGTYAGSGLVLDDNDFKIADRSVYSLADTNDPVSFSDPTLNNWINFTCNVWSNATYENARRLGQLISRRGVNDEGDFYLLLFADDGGVDKKIRFIYLRQDGVAMNAVTFATTDFYNNDDWELISVRISVIGTTVTADLLINGTVVATESGATTPQSSTIPIVLFDASNSDDRLESYKGGADDISCQNFSMSDSDIQTHIWASGSGKKLVATEADITAPTLSKDGINNTIPKINDIININITITETESDISGYIFSWDNGTGIFKNDSFVDLSGENLTIANVSVNKTIEVAEGTIIQYQWFANDTSRNMGSSSIFSFTVAGTTPPNVTIHGTNFFASDNSTIISLFQALSARLNFSFTDNIDLFGFVINITLDDVVIFNLTNLTLNGTIDNFTNLINVQGPQGTYKVNITVADTHTAKVIPYYDVRKGFNWLEYDGKIRIEAEGAIWTSTTKYYDRYDFKFNYLPFIAPKNKVFYIESDGPLIYQHDSIFKAHFVDYKNRRWIDFEGLEGQPIVTKINDRRWKIEFTNSDSEVIFNSIGGLNEDSFEFEYYLSNVSVSFFVPKESPTNFLSSFSVSLNVTGDGRNETRFRLYNSSKELIGSANISATGTGTYFYNTTFTGLDGVQFFVNATHIDINGQTSNSTTITFDSIQVEDCTAGFPAINFTIKDELNSSRVRGDSTAVFDYNGTVKIFQFTKSFTNQDNFSICILPARESLLVDYQITYEASGFPQRIATESDIAFNNATQTTDLFLLRTVDGIFATFRIIDSFQNPIPGVTSSFTKAGVTIETRDTDDAGIVSFFVNPDTTYIFTFIKTGFVTSTNSLRITTADIITITLESGAEEQVTSFITGISYFFQPQNQILNNNTDITFSFNLTSSFWNITGCTLRLKNSSEELAQGDCQFNGSLSNVSIFFNTGNQSIIIAEATYELNGTTNNTVSYSYRVENIFKGSFSLRNFLDDITNFSAGAFDDFNRFLIAVLITLFVVGGLSLQSTEFREPEILIPAVWIMVAFFSYLGWMNIPLDTIPQIRGLPEDWLNKWNVFVLTSMLGGAYLIKKHLK